jgi:hypothetical protein
LPRTFRSKTSSEIENDLLQSPHLMGKATKS